VYPRLLVSPSELTAPAAFGRGILLIDASLVIAGLISCVALVGWLAGFPLLTNWGPDFVTMKPVTALAILLIASAILPQLPLAPRWRIALGVIAALLGASNLVQELGGLDLGLESWLAPAGTPPGPGSANFRMSPATALAVLLVGTATASLPFPRLADAVRFSAAGVCVIGATALLGYLLGVDALYSFPPYNSVALPTAIALIAIGAAVLLHSWSSSPARGGNFRLLLSQFFAPLLIFSLFTWWSWRNVEADARADAERTAASFSEYALRVFEIQETALEAVLHHVKGRSTADIAADRSIHEFISEIEKQTPTSDAIILVRSDSGRVIAWSRGFPAPDVDVSQRDYFKAHRDGNQGTYIGEVISTAPFGSIGFTISRSDPATGIVAVAHMSIDSFMRLSDVQASPRDALTLARADGMALVLNPPLADPVGFRLHEDGMTLRLIGGELKAGTIAPSSLDGVERLWEFRKVGHYPVYAIYGLDVVLIRAAWLHQIIPFGMVAFLASALTFGMSRAWQTTQKRLAAIVTSSADAIISKTPDGIVTTWNEGAERMFGYAAGEMIGQSIRRLIPADRQPEEDMMLARLARGERIEHYETVRVAKDGRAIDVSVTISPLRTAEGRIIGGSKVVRDITARKRAEAQLAEREAQLALFVKHAPAAIAMFDDKMRFLAVSRRFLSDYRLPAEAEVIGRSCDEVFPEFPQRWREIQARVLAGEELSHEEDPFPRLDGRIDRVQWSMKPWRTADGRIGGAMLFTQLMTRALAEREARFQATFENAAVGIAHVAPDGRWLRVNEALCRILGYPADELVTRSFQDITHPDDLAADLADLKRMLDGKIDRYDADKRFVRKDGSIVWVRLTVGCVRESDRSIDYFVSVVEDISARKHAEEELRKSEERFRSSLVHSPLPILLFDDREQILAVSQSWSEETGYSREELRRIEDWTTRACRERSGEVLERIRQIISTEPEAEPAELTIRTKDGRECLWSVVTSALGTQSDGRRLFVCMAQDVTERKAHEEQVHLLMREVNHRAKNMLGLVLAIARQTAASEPDDFVERFSERIRALAANQDLLVRNEWQGIEVEDLVRAHLAHFADLVGARIAVHGPKLRLNAAAAQAIGLALHELATNAGKYGALSVDAGRVDLQWRREGDIFAISWTEHNGPPVSPPQRRGFGSTVVGSMAKLSVGGEVELDFAPSGLVWRLTCPAANALEPGEREQISHEGENRTNNAIGKVKERITA
jgi:PAS domain S-box-containing protein